MATHIKDLLNDFFKENEKKIKEKERIQAIIDDVIGDPIKRYISLRGVDKKKVVIFSDSSSVKYEMNLKKKELLESLKKEIPFIEDIQITTS